MANQRMKIQTTDPMFSRTMIHQRTMDNWYHAVSSTTILEKKLRESFNNWLDAQATGEPQFWFRGDSPRFLPNLLDDIQALTPRRNIRTEFQFSDDNGQDLLINGVGFDELSTVSMANMRFEETALPLAIIGTHRVLVRRQYGMLWNLNWNITIAGCVQTATMLGVPVESR